MTIRRLGPLVRALSLSLSLPAVVRYSTCDPPHEQWLVGLGAGGVSQEKEAASTSVVVGVELEHC
jgi:hypothetical protein